LNDISNHGRELSLESEANMEAGGGWMFALKSTFTLDAHILYFPGLSWQKMKSIFETNSRRCESKKIIERLIKA